MFERDAWGVIRRRRTERVCSCVFVCVCPCPWVYAWMPIMYVRNSEHLCMWVCMCGRVSSHFQSIELLRCWCMLSAVLVLVQQNIMCGVKERGDGRKQKEGGGGLHGGGCLSLWIGSGWFTSSGHWWLPLPCCKTSSCGPAWTLGALCPTLAGNMPPKVLLPPTTTVHPQHLQSFALSISLHPFHPCSSTALCQPQAGGEGNKT